WVLKVPRSVARDPGAQMVVAAVGGEGRGEHDLRWAGTCRTWGAGGVPARDPGRHRWSAQPAREAAPGRAVRGPGKGRVEVVSCLYPIVSPLTEVADGRDAVRGEGDRFTEPCDRRG